MNTQELFNLRHAQCRNVVERIFGVIKKRWDILTRPPRYDMDIQSRIPPALAALHNFILKHDSVDREDILEDLDISDPDLGDCGDLAEEIPDQAEKECANSLRDTIAKEMWVSYQQYLADHPELLDSDEEMPEV